MIEKVEELIYRFIDLEQIVCILEREDDSPEDFNKELLELEKLIIPKMKNKLGVVFKNAMMLKMLNQKQVDKTAKELSEIIMNNKYKINKRILFKISEIQKDVFKVFTSFPNPRGRSYGECLVTQKIDDVFIITALYFLRSDDGLNYYWQFNSGEDTFSFGKEEPLSIKKYEVPENDEKSIAYHNNDKL